MMPIRGVDARQKQQRYDVDRQMADGRRVDDGEVAKGERASVYARYAPRMCNMGALVRGSSSVAAQLAAASCLCNLRQAFESQQGREVGKWEVRILFIYIG